MRHPLYQFQFCPIRGTKAFVGHSERVKKCMTYGFAYYLNPSSAVACFIKSAKGELLLVRRGKEPAKGTLDLPDDFTDMFESREGAVRREMREETGPHIRNCRYLFSLPNLYMRSGFEVHTLNMLYEYLVDDSGNVHAEDDAVEIVILRPESVNPEGFGLDSIRKAVPAYLRK